MSFVLYKSRGELTEYLVINQDPPSPTPSPPHSQKNIQWMSRKDMSHTRLPSHQISMYSLENHIVSTPLLLHLSKKHILKSSRQIKNKEYILFWLRVNPKLRNSRIEHFVLSSFSVIKYWHIDYFLSFLSCIQRPVLTSTLAAQLDKKSYPLDFLRKDDNCKKINYPMSERIFGRTSVTLWTGL